jgi:hypothetical protein
MTTTRGVRVPGYTGPMRELTMRPTIKNGYSNDMEKTLSETPLLRSELGDVLRGIRQRQGRTLREVSSEAQVSLGYLSEVERGQKEASSELLEAITSALRVPLWFVLREVSERMAIIDGAVIPDAVPDDLVPVTLIS